MDILQQLENKGFRVTVGVYRLLAKLDVGQSVPVLTEDGTAYVISLQGDEAHIHRHHNPYADMSFPILIEHTGAKASPATHPFARFNSEPLGRQSRL